MKAPPFKQYGQSPRGGVVVPEGDEVNTEGSVHESSD